MMVNLGIEAMEVVLRSYGNSTVVTLLPSVLRNLRLKAGQTMILNTTPDGRITLAPKRRYTLADLLAQCDPKAAPPVNLALWENARPVGQEWSATIILTGQRQLS